MDKRIWTIVLIVWCGLIFLASAMPVFNDAHSMGFFLQIGLPLWLADIIDYVVRKLAHILMFAALAFIALQVIKPRRGEYILAWLFATLYGASDEWHQLYVAGRSAALGDVAYDSAGALVTLLALYLWGKARK